MDATVNMTGMVEFKGKLDRFRMELPEITKQISLEAATITVDTARPTVPRKSGAAASSLQAYVTGTGAVAQGGGTVDYYRWLELGGASGRKLANVRPQRPFPPGRYIYPGYEKSIGRIENTMNEGLSRAVQRGGLG